MSEPATKSQLNAVHTALTIMLVVIMAIILINIMPLLSKIEKMQPCSTSK